MRNRAQAPQARSTKRYASALAPLMSEPEDFCNGVSRIVTRQLNTALISWDFFFPTARVYFLDLRPTRRFLRIFLESLLPIKHVARMERSEIREQHCNRHHHPRIALRFIRATPATRVVGAEHRHSSLEKWWLQ